MTTPLQQAAQAMIDRWESPDWKDTPHTAHYIAELRKALVDEIAQSVEPYAVFHGLVDSGEHGAFNLDLLKMIPRGAYLYLHQPQPQATTPAVPTLTEALAQQGIKLRTEFEPKQQDKTSLTDVPEGIKALLCVKPKIVTGPCGQCGSSADPCYCGNVNTGEPSGERAELIAKLRTGWTVMEESEFERLDGLCRKAADMLEADAQQAKRVPPEESEDLYALALKSDNWGQP